MNIHRYHIVYRKKDGKIKSYSATPIEENNQDLKVYAFGGVGVKTFKKDRIIKLTETKKP